MISGSVNYYSIDPFNNPYQVYRDPDPDNQYHHESTEKGPKPQIIFEEDYSHPDREADEY